MVEMFTKGSPSAPSWHGEKSIIGAPGYKLLRELPPSPPLPKMPREVTMKAEYLKRLSGEQVRKFCNINRLGSMLDILLDMAKTGAVPSLGPATVEDLASMDTERYRKIIGYGVIEKIGDAASHWHILPFMRPPLEYIYSVQKIWDLDSVHAPSHGALWRPHSVCLG